MQLNYDSILKDFINESTVLLEKAERSVLDLEREFRAETVDDLFRSIHTIKGNSGLINSPGILALAHAFETVLNSVRSGNLVLEREAIDIALQSIDRLGDLVRGIPEGKVLPVDDLVQKLRNIEILSTDHQEVKGTSDDKVRISSRFIDRARETNQFLSFIQLDWMKQGISSLSDAAGILSRFNGEVLLKGIHLERNRERSTFNQLPAYLLLLTKEKPEKFLTARGIRAGKIKYLNVPVQTGQKSPEVMPGENAEKGVATGENRMEAVDTHLRVPFRLIDSLINLAGETVIARNELVQKSESSGDLALSLTAKKISQLITRLQEGIMRTRLQELNTVFLKLPRIVRDLCAVTGKKVDISVDGGEVELDKTLIEAISESLTHMIRNSVDHGIESREERIKAGKSETGRIDVKARLQGGHVIITVQDDGRGLDVEKISRTAVLRGLLSPEQAKKAAPEDLFELIFAPGFSTAESITSTSGRGVGMDVVRTGIRKMGGSLEITSRPLLGAAFTVSIPQTLTVTTCLLVRASGQRYAIPQQNIAELIIAEPEMMRNMENHQMYSLRDKLLPVISLSRFLNPGQESRPENFIAVIKTERYRFGILIEEIINPEEIVVRPLGELFSDLPLYAGAAIMGDGEAVLILDATGIARASGLQAEKAQEEKRSDKNEIRIRTNYIIFESSGRLFAVLLTAAPRIARVQNGQIEVFMGLETFHFHGNVVPILRLNKLYGLAAGSETEEYVLVFAVGSRNAAIAAAQIHSIVHLDESREGSFSGAGVVGHSILEGRTVVIIDPSALVEQGSTVERGSAYAIS